MSFSSEWLSLRAEADERARNRELAKRLEQHFGNSKGLRVLDLGSGAGANMRLTSQLLGRDQHWILTDNDADLLGQIDAEDGVTFETHQVDLAREMEAVLDGPFDLITASAFFDLVGKSLIEEIVTATARTGAAFYTVLTYDGEEEWTPAHPADEAVHSAFLADQRSDKGLGAALGPEATSALAAAFAAKGYTTFQAKSDWDLSNSRDADLIAALADGTSDAIRDKVGSIANDWKQARRTAETVRIGHLDLLALPPV